MALKDFNPDDKATLGEMVRAFRERQQQPSVIVPDEHVPPAPPFYVARVTSTFPALTQNAVVGIGTGSADADTPGSLVCDIYRITTSGALEAIGISRTIYNVSLAAIEVGTPGDVWIPIARTKGGKWIAACCPVGGAGTGTAPPCCGLCATAPTACCFVTDLDGFVTGTGTPTDCPTLNDRYFLDQFDVDFGTGSEVCGWRDLTVCALPCCGPKDLFDPDVVELRLTEGLEGQLGKARVVLRREFFAFPHEELVVWEKEFTGTPPTDCADFTEASPVELNLISGNPDCKGAAATCSIWMYPSAPCPLRRCPPLGTNLNCVTCDDMPRDWIVDLGVGGWTTDNCTSSSQGGCAGIEGEFAMGDLQDDVPIVGHCRWVFEFAAWCNSNQGDLTVELRYIDLGSNNRRYQVTVSLIRSLGFGQSAAIYHSTTWNTVTNPDCMHLADSSGRIPLTKISDAHTEALPPCQGTLPTTIHIFDGLA